MHDHATHWVKLTLTCADSCVYDVLGTLGVHRQVELVHVHSWAPVLRSLPCVFASGEYL